MEEESNIKFPCHFPVKAMGKNSDQFEIAVLSIVRAHFPELQENALSLRTSRDNNYLSITINVYAEDKDSLDALYQELSNCDMVLMTL